MPRFRQQSREARRRIREAQSTRAQTLELNMLELTALPAELVQLTNLETLWLFGNQLTALPAGLGQLTNLKSLSVRGNQLTALPAELGQLTNLVFLDLGTNELTGLPRELGRLTNLRELNVATNPLTELPAEFGQLTNLEQLDLRCGPREGVWRKGLTKLPAELGELSNLRQLWLGSNQLTELPAELGKLTNLSSLDLSGNRLTELPAELGKLTNLWLLKLEGNPLSEPLRELATQGTEAVLAYLRSLPDAEAQYEAKLLLVGDGGAGKTSVAAQLRGKGFDPNRSSTHGIELAQLRLPHPDPTLDGEATITLHTWDFGGQPLYQATHQLFLTPKALYLLVWNLRHGTGEQVDRWLRRIHLLVGDQARVLLVATHADDHRADLDLATLQQTYPTVLADLIEVDNRSGTGIDRLRQAIAEQAALLPQMGEKISRKWTAARDQLLAGSEPQLDRAACVAVCTDRGLDAAAADALLALLHMRGQLLWYAEDPGLRELVVLQPEWLAKAISYVLKDEATVATGGVLDHARLRKIWQHRAAGPTYPAPFHPYLLRLMEQFDVCYRLGDPDRPSEQTSSLVGQLVPQARPPLPWQLEDPPAPGTRELAVYVALKDQAPGLMAKLIVRNHRFSTERHWRNGVFLALSDGFASEGLLELAAHERELALTVRAPEPGYLFFVLLDSIRQLLRTRWPGLDYDLLVPCQHRHPDRRRCTGRFHRHALVQLYQRDQPTIPCSVCGTAQNVAGMLTAVATTSRPDPGGTVELHARLIQALQGGLEQVIRAEIAPMRAQLSHIETIVAEIAVVADIIRAQLQLWTITYETTSGTPRLFTLTPVAKHGLEKALDKAAVWQDTYQLTLWCEHADQPHPWPPARYQFTRPRDWLVTIAPYALSVLSILRLAANVGMPIATLANVNLKSVKDDLEAMSKLLEQLPTQPPHHPAASGQAAYPVQADGPELRTLRALLTELDPTRAFKECMPSRPRPEISGGSARTTTRPTIPGCPLCPHRSRHAPHCCWPPPGLNHWLCAGSYGSSRQAASGQQLAAVRVGDAEDEGWRIVVTSRRAYRS